MGDTLYFSQEKINSKESFLILVQLEETEWKKSLATAIMNGDVEKVKIMIARYPDLIFADINPDLSSSSSSSSSDSSDETINVLDLSVKHKQVSVLSIIIEEAIKNKKEDFENFLIKSVFLHNEEILKAVMKQDSRVGLILLNKDVNHLNDNEISLNFKHLGDKVTETVLTDGCKDIAQHPTFQSFSLLSWRNNRIIFFAYLFINLLYTISLSASVVVQNYYSNSNSSFTILLILSFILYVPVICLESLMILCSNKVLISKVKTTFKILHFVIYIIYFISSLCQVSHDLIIHLTAWTILSAWFQIISLLHDLPETFFYIEMFLNVLTEILKFIIIFISVLFGFSLTLHTLFSSNPENGELYSSPINSYLKILSFTSGELNFDPSHLETGGVNINVTFHIIFILIFLILNIVMINIMIGLTINSIHRSLQVSDNIRFVKTLLCNHIMKSILKRLKKFKGMIYISKKCCCWNLLEKKIPKEIIIKMKEESGTKTESLMNKFQSNIQTSSLPSTISVYMNNNVTDDIVKTAYKLPKDVLDACLDILDERKQKHEEELAIEAEKCQG